MSLEDGATLLDGRPTREFDAAYVAGSINTTMDRAAVGTRGVGRRPAGGGAPDRRERRGGAANGPAARGRRLSEPGRRARGRRSGLARCGLPTDSTPPSTSPSSPSACAATTCVSSTCGTTTSGKTATWPARSTFPYHGLRTAFRPTSETAASFGRRLLGGKPQLDRSFAAQARRRRGRRPRRRRRRRRPRARGREARQRRLSHACPLLESRLAGRRSSVG